MVYSYDVFDTLIMRKVKTPRGVFVLMSERMLQDSSYYDIPYEIRSGFVEYRVRAEYVSRQYKKTEEVTLNEIYSIFIDMTGCLLGQSNRIIQLEIMYEKKLSAGIVANIAEAESLVNRGERVILISDMYLPLNTVSEMVSTQSKIIGEQPLFLSNELGLTKSSGSLYTMIKHMENIVYNDWKHVGDNPLSDVIVPQMLGIETKKHVLRINDYPGETAAGEVICGIRKMLENNNSLSNEEKIGAYYVGPILYSYVKWVICLSLAEEIKDLFFLARDGYILKKIADIIIKNNEYGIQTHYLYASRKTWCVDGKEKKDALMGYVMQNLRLTTGKYAFVDTQGTGKSLDTMSEICGIRSTGFYFCTVGNHSFSRINRHFFVDSNKNAKLIEVFCRAPHGATEEYRLVDGMWQPLLSEYSIDKNDKERFREYIDGILLFTREFNSIEKSLQIDISLNKELNRLFAQIVDYPEEYIWDFFGEWKHDDFNDDEKKLAPYLSKEDLLECIRGVKEYKGSKIELSKKRLSVGEQKELQEEEKQFFNSCIVSENITGRKRVIVYGAGVKGKEAISILAQNLDIAIIGWTDRMADSYIEQGWNLVTFEESRKMPYDCYLIAVGKDKDKVCHFLAECGIEKDRIRTLVDEVIE